MSLMDKCCESCTHSKDNYCPDYIMCRTKGPLCHTSEGCKTKIANMINETIYGDNNFRISVGMSTCGLASGAKSVYDAFQIELKERNLDAKLVKTGCMGNCYAEVVVEIVKKGCPEAIYDGVTPEKVKIILDAYLEGNVKGAYALRHRLDTMKGEMEVPLLNELDYFKHQERDAIQLCGIIDPQSIEEYIIHGGYAALTHVIKDMKPEDVINEVMSAGLRGRGGAGFPAGLKWRICNQVKNDVKYMICNADEGDPGAFMNRLTAEGDPHRVLEGLIIAAYAIGATDAFIFVRAEKPLMAERLAQAVEQAKKLGLLGKNIMGSSFSLEVTPMLSAGAFVCGEETALMAAIEGKRAMPRTRPPFPATQGLWDKPTTINNVETLSHVPTIMVTGGKEYAKIGSQKSKGTKVYCLAGKINRTGAAEVPIGTSMRELVFGIGGGVGGGKKFKAVQIGGPSGGCLSESCLDLPLDYESLQSAGAIMGSGGIIIANEDTCIVDLAKYFLTFTTTESCGKCTPCRIGLPKMLDILTRITEGKGEEEDISRLQEIAVSVADSSLCALGRTAPNPVLTTLKYFRDEYESHIKEKRCPAHVCANLVSYRINPDLCVACGLCIKNCPSDAIRFEEKVDESTNKAIKKAVIDVTKCVHCGRCFEVCPKDAVVKE